MSMSLYYNAVRETAMNDEEREGVQTAAGRYIADYPFETRHEDFCLYSEPLDGENVILAGATKIPQRRGEFYEVILHWLKCLTEIRRALHGCEWDVRLDNVDLIWDEKEGWRLPTDDEMKARKGK